jgi:uracil-DNA glycosylase
MLVAKDFADVPTFVDSRGRPNPTVATNRNLVTLFEAAGLPLSLPAEESEDRYFFTNVVLCMKTGGMSASLPAEYVRRCATRFLRRTLEIVQPKVVVALGADPLEGISHAFDLGYEGEPIGPLVDEFRTFELPWGGKVIPAFHPSRFPGGKRRSIEHWRRIGREVARAT